MSELKSQLWSCVGAKLMLTADGGVSLCNPRELVGAISDALSVCADGGQQQEMFGESVDL